MRPVASLAALALISGAALGQAPGKFPPDSLVNTKLFAKSTPVIQVVGAMRNFAGDLGVRCQFCHVGEEGMPLERFDFEHAARALCESQYVGYTDAGGREVARVLTLLRWLQPR